MAETRDGPPTLYEWAGGEAALERLINAFYNRVEGDELLSPLFPGGTAVWGSPRSKASALPR